MKKHAGAVDIEQVLLGDLEDATHLPPGMAINGVQVGNWMWRSPEAHAEGYVDKPSDMFSFGIVVSGSDCHPAKPDRTHD